MTIQMQSAGASTNTVAYPSLPGSPNTPGIHAPTTTQAPQLTGDRIAANRKRENTQGLQAALRSSNLAALVAFLQSACDGLDERMQAVSLRDSVERDARKDQLKTFYDAMRAAEKAAKSGLISKITGWILKAVAFIVASAMLVGTAGTASPLAVGLMSAALLLSVYDIASSAAMEANNDLKIGLADGCGKAMGLLARACGADEKKIKEIEQWGGMALSMVIQLGVTFGAGIALLPNQMKSALDAARQALRKVGDLFTSIGTFPGKLIGSAFVKLADKLDQPMLEKMGHAIRAASSRSSAAKAGGEAAESSAKIAPALSQNIDALRLESIALTSIATPLAVGASLVQAGTSGIHAVTSLVAGLDSYEAAILEADRVCSEANLEFIQSMNQALLEDVEGDIETAQKITDYVTSIQRQDDDYNRKIAQSLGQFA